MFKYIFELKNFRSKLDFTKNELIDLEIRDFLKFEGNYVNKIDDIITVGFWNEIDRENETTTIKAGKTGFLHYKKLKHNIPHLMDDDHVFSIFHDKETYEKVIKIEQDKSNIKKDKEKCFVYLMIDTTNNYHKIGMSNKPKYREKTLQSEKPTIELICSKEFPNRELAASFEKALHQTYAEYNIRGEWFNLPSEIINDIKMTLK